MHILVAQYLTNLPVAQRRLPFIHFPCDWRIRTGLLQKLCRRHGRRDCVICGIENLESKSALRDTQVADLTQVSCVDVAPRIALAGFGQPHMLWKVPFVLVGLDHIPDAEDIDIHAEAAGECAGNALTAEFRAGVGVHWVDVVGVFV